MTEHLVPSQAADVFTTGEGVKFRVRKVSRILLEAAINKLKLPKVPRVFIEEKGREEENPLDPDYRQTVLDVMSERGNLSLNIILSMGLELLEPLPPHMEHPNSEHWAAIVEETGVEVPSVEVKGLNSRFVAWVKYIAVPDPSELAEIIKMTARQTYTLEADVDNALVAFPGVSQPGADSEPGRAQANT